MIKYAIIKLGIIPIIIKGIANTPALFGHEQGGQSSVVKSHGLQGSQRIVFGDWDPI